MPSNLGAEVRPAVPQVLDGDPWTFPQPPVNWHVFSSTFDFRQLGHRPKQCADLARSGQPHLATSFWTRTRRHPEQLWFHWRSTQPSRRSWLSGPATDSTRRTLEATAQNDRTSATYQQASAVDLDRLNMIRQTSGYRTCRYDVGGRLLTRQYSHRQRQFESSDGRPRHQASNCPTNIIPASLRNKWPLIKEEQPEHWRRSVYIYAKRQLLMPLMELFVAPTTTDSCAVRSQSVVPTQALVLMNDQLLSRKPSSWRSEYCAKLPPSNRSSICFELLLALAI